MTAHKISDLVIPLVFFNSTPIGINDAMMCIIILVCVSMPLLFHRRYSTTVIFVYALAAVVAAMELWMGYKWDDDLVNRAAKGLVYEDAGRCFVQSMCASSFLLFVMLFHKIVSKRMFNVVKTEVIERRAKVLERPVGSFVIRRWENDMINSVSFISVVLMVSFFILSIIVRIDL